MVAVVFWKVTVVAPVQKESSLDITGMSFSTGDNKQRKNTVGMGERETDAPVTSCTTAQDSWTEPACRAECSMSGHHPGVRPHIRLRAQSQALHTVSLR